ISQRGRFHSFGKNIGYSIEGSGDGFITFLVPYVDEKNAGILAAMLSIIDDITMGGIQPRSHVEIYFLGSIDENKGVREFVNNISFNPPDALFYLSSGELLGDIIRQKPGSNGKMTPLWLVRHIEEQLSAYELPRGLYHTPLYRAGLLSSETIAPLLKENLQAVGLTILPESREDLPGRKSLRFLADLVLNTEVPANDSAVSDLHYLDVAIPVFGPIIAFINERTYIVVTLVIIQVLIALFITKNLRLRRIHQQGRNVLCLAFFILAVWSSLFVSRLIIKIPEMIRGIDEMFMLIPIPFILLAISIFLLIFKIIMLALHRLLPRIITVQHTHSFYSRTAIIMFGLNLIIYASIHITFSHYFIWAILISLLFALSSHSLLKFFCLAAAALPLLISFANFSLFFHYADAAIGNVSADFLAACIILPFIFMTLDIIDPEKSTEKSPATSTAAKSPKKLTAAMLISAPIILTLIVLFINPFSAENPQQIHIDISNTLRTYLPINNGSRTENTSNSMRIFTIRATSNAPLRNVSLDTPSLSFTVDTQSAAADLPPQILPARAYYAIRKNTLFRRSSYRIELGSAEHQPQNISIQLFTGESTTIYHSTFPYISSGEPGNIRFLTGINPPNPLVFELILPNTISPRFEIELIHMPENAPKKRAENTAANADEENIRKIGQNNRLFTLQRRERIIFEPEQPPKEQADGQAEGQPKEQADGGGNENS
ncbi:MAG: hypothetical protein ACR2PY_09595, partial [Salinispira sp.]